MTLQLPAPEPENPQESTNARQRGRRKSRASIPDVDTILEMLLQLNGLVTMQVLSTGQAGVIQRGLRIVLDTLQRRCQAGANGPPPEELAQLCRQDPALLRTLEPFLTDEQIRFLLGEVTEDADGQA